MVEKYNVQILNAALLYPPEIFLSTTRPLRTVADIKGLKIRTAGDDGTVFTQMGASVVMVPAGEIYEAMKRGTIDAFQYMSPAGDASIGFHEVVKYVYLSPVRQPCSTSFVVANKTRWAELPADLQAIVENAFLGEAWRFYGEVVQEDAKALEKYKARGAVVAPIPPEIATEVSRLAEKLFSERAAKDPFYAEVLNSRHNFQKALRAMYERM
jgi:TRAP-type mannitol/chloroaromatic compound transport system substrate-binding protein